MLLRSGTVKELIAKCYNCNEFYGNKKYKYKCSGCYRGLKNQYPWKDEGFRNSVNEWAQEKIRISNVCGGFRALRGIIRQTYNGTWSKELRVTACKNLINTLRFFRNFKI